jgi:hypothetical protein
LYAWLFVRLIVCAPDCCWRVYLNRENVINKFLVPLGIFAGLVSCYASKLHDPGSEALAARELAWKFRWRLAYLPIPRLNSTTFLSCCLVLKKLLKNSLILCLKGWSHAKPLQSTR